VGRPLTEEPSQLSLWHATAGTDWSPRPSLPGDQQVDVAIVGAGFLILNREVRTLAESYGSGFRFALLPAQDAMAIVLFAGVLGWLGAQLAVARHLRDIEPR